MNRMADAIKITPTRTSNKNGLLGWFFDTKELDSVDVTDHLDLLLKELKSYCVDMKKIKEMGCSYLTYCFWSSVSGNGGPELKPRQMAELAAMDMELHFDLWFDPPEEESV